MSKSFKKNPIIKDGKSGTVGKTLANHRVRRNTDDIPNGKAYRKYFNTYDVHDYISRYTWAERQSLNESEEKAHANGAISNRLWRFRTHMGYNEWARMMIRK